MDGMWGNVKGLWRKDWKSGKDKMVLEKGCECGERFGERMGMQGKVRGPWRKDGNAGKGFRALEKGMGVWG